MLSNFQTAISAALMLSMSTGEHERIGYNHVKRTKCRTPGKPGKPGDKIARLARNSACGLRGKTNLKF